MTPEGASSQHAVLSQTMFVPKKPNITESNLIISQGSGDLGQHFSQTHVPVMLDIYLPYD